MSTMANIENKNFQLIYHKDRVNISPFDAAITNMVNNKSILVACPYIGIKYFNRLISLSNSWRLITDVEEWILSHNDKNSRFEIVDFIKNNSDKIHHIKNLHAKIILTNEKAIIGSANFTETGIKNKIEISVLIEEKKFLEELNEWFLNLWNKSKNISIEELEKFYYSIKKTYHKTSVSNSVYSLSTSAYIKTKLVDLNFDKSIVSKNVDNREMEARLIKILKFYPSKKWIGEYLDLVKTMIDTFNIKNDDVRISMVIPKKGKRLPVNVGQRWVIRPYINGEIGMIMPLEYDESNFKKDNAFEEAGYFYINKKKVARWIHFNRKDGLVFSDRIIKYWLNAVEKELERTKISGRRFAHRSLFYQLVTNYDCRNYILSRAFKF